eukprot:6176529-Pleurochrysis_carterae.AAC.5
MPRLNEHSLLDTESQIMKSDRDVSVMLSRVKKRSMVCNVAASSTAVDQHHTSDSVLSEWKTR